MKGFGGLSGGGDAPGIGCFRRSPCRPSRAGDAGSRPSCLRSPSLPTPPANSIPHTASEPAGVALSPAEAAQRTRRLALELADGLERERVASEQRLAELKQDDVLKRVTGTSALERAIAEARRIAAQLERAAEAR